MCEIRNSSLLGKITVFFIICCCCLPAHAKYGGGTGEPNKPYLIYTAGQMNAIGADSNDWDKHFKLMADIDLSAYTGESFNIIGYYVKYNDNKPFTGVFDGNEHTISNFTYDSNNTFVTGLFRYVSDPNAEIRNLGLINPNVDARTKNGIGSLVGWLHNGTISACYAVGGSILGRYRIGGLVGMNYGTITNCYSSSSVMGNKYVGGFVGESFRGTITNCYSTGSVSGNYQVGGLLGRNDGTISNSYSTADVTGDDNVGGLTGYNHDKITYCYSTGTVFGNWDVGGLVGSNYGSFLGCFWDIQTSGQTTSTGGKGKTTDQMKDLNTFLYWGVCGNQGVWTIDDGIDYPRLATQNLPGALIVTSEPVYGGGSGNQADPYQIWTAEQLNKIGLIPCHWDKHFMLMADIDLSGFTGSEFNIIAIDYYNPFSSVFEGNGHTISNFTYTSTSRNNTGLFGYVCGPGAEIKNLGLIGTNVYVETGDDVGSLVGQLDLGTISNCYVEGGSVAGDQTVGGLVGNNNGKITNCYVMGSVFGNYHVGALVGYNENSIIDCYTSGNVTGGDNSSYIGGLCGKSAGPHHGTGLSRIQNCFSKATVTGNESVGGLIGHNGRTVAGCYSTGSVIGRDDYSWRIGGLIGRNGGHGSIINSYSIGSVVGDEHVGGLVGDNEGTVVASYWDIETSGNTTSNGGTGLTTGEMQMASTFVCWGYEPVWTIDDGVDYPRLVWENKPGDLITVPSDLYGGGTGEPEDPYLIYTAEQLNMIGLYSCYWKKDFKLMEDIDLGEFTGTSVNIIGNGYHSPFSGVFDGNGRKIFNFKYTSTSVDDIGFFGFVSGVIKDLELIEPNVDAGTGHYVGSLVGWLYNGTLTNCIVEGGSVEGDSHVGGLVGCNYHGTISKCYSTAGVSAVQWVSGLVGYNNHGTITDCYSSGTVSGDFYVGGLIGRNRYGPIAKCYTAGSVIGNIYVGGLVGEGYRGAITDSYSTCIVSGDQHVGGLVGLKNRGTITNCYSKGSVTGTANVGGLVGRKWKAEVNNSFWDIETSGQDWSDGGTGLPTDQMQMAGTFTDAGWDFVGVTFNGIEDIWFIPRQDYPHLWWEGMQVSMKLAPRTLNCRSQGNWVKAHLTLPQGLTVADVDSNRPALLHSFGLESDTMYVFVNKNERVQIEATFERQAVCSLAGNWPDALTVAGFLADGNIFLGSSSIRIKHPGLKVIEELAWYWLNEDCVPPDFCNGIDMNRDSLVNLLDYALLMKINVEFVADE
jgi:hypothetical protein